MGTKRIGLARVQALIENLKRELDLDGTTLKSAVNQLKNAEQIKFTEPTAVPVGQGNHDLWSIAIPANSLVTDVGYLVEENNVNAGSGTTITIAIGDASGQDDIVTALQVNQTSSDLARGISQSVSCGNLPHSSGAALGFAAAAPLHYTAAGSIFMRVTVGSTNLVDANGKITMFVKYVDLSAPGE
tara:strand:- start:497 stop:1054 length:558 start_codon:yes stop_codon:yes gene_type:complete